MVKYLNRIVALFLCCSLLFNSVKIVDAAVPSINTDDIQIYSVPVRSNECPDLENVTFYGYNEKYYLAIQDICILRSPADSDAFQSGRCAEHNGRPESLVVMD